jgi:DNA-directed RNA polymerase specialized sigma24 family protein
MQCYLKHDELAFKQEELQRFMEERYTALVAPSRHDGVSLVGLAFPFLLLDTISYQVGERSHKRLVVCEHVPPAPYNLAQRIYWSEALTKEQEMWALEVVSGWALSAGVKPYLHEAVQPMAWMGEMAHIYRKRYLPFMADVKFAILESAKECEGDSRARSFLIQEVLDQVAEILYRKVRTNAKRASAYYRKTISKEVGFAAEDQGEVESGNVSEFNEEPLDESDRRAPWQQPEAGVEDAFEMYEWVKSFQRQLDELSKDKRAIVSLKQKGWSHQAIAEELNLPLHQVDSGVRHFQRLATNALPDEVLKAGVSKTEQ